MDENAKPALDSAVLSYYTRRAEETRLERGISQLEAVRTRDLIERHAPPPPAAVLDVGGAAGAYAAWLADRGYAVHLVDAVPRLVEEARRRNAGENRPILSLAVADARALEQSASSVDVLLMLGPLYHLTTSADRATALGEAYRVLRAGGVLFAAAISRWASALDGLVHDTLAAPDFAAAVERAVRDGQHRNETEREGMFTTAYFHRPEELQDEVRGAGFELVGVYGIEGPARMFADFEDRWADPRRRADMLRIAAVVEAEPSLLGLSSHLMVVARKPISDAPADSRNSESDERLVRDAQGSGRYH
ncbi:MAG TPA: methyltransferase domain-containing protein [Gemmatimonadaceae bacterium]|nr:methyltransferase domain-containing protein [Gemmatimonadaceae bacterium]